MYGRAFAMILMTAVLCLGGMTNAPAAPTSNAAVTSAPVREGAVTVRETVAETIAHHRGLKVIQENLDVTRYELRRAKAGWGPSVDATGRYGASRLSDNTTRSYGSDKGMYAASGVGITLTQPPWDGFATRSRVRTGEATVESWNTACLTTLPRSVWMASSPMWTTCVGVKSCASHRKMWHGIRKSSLRSASA
mgnify:CR=1 FL=1